MKRKRIHYKNRWLDFTLWSGGVLIGYGRGELYVKTLLFMEWRKQKTSKWPLLRLDNLGIEIEVSD